MRAQILFAAEKDADAIARALVHSAFARLADVDVVLWASPAPMDSAAMAGVLRWFALRWESDVEALWVYGVERAAVLPPLLVRSAVVDDHDDLAPVLQRCRPPPSLNNPWASTHLRHANAGTPLGAAAPVPEFRLVWWRHPLGC